MTVRATGQTGRVLSAIRSFGKSPISAGRDFENGGKYQVVGTTKVKGSPDYAVSRRVRLHDQLTGLLVREQWSVAGTGVYTFDRIRSGNFYVVALDHTSVHNGVIATNVQSELMP
jgi:hypothetical protein